MNSKEYLAQLEKTINTFEKNKLNEFGFSMSIEMAKDVLNTFNQDLERLEQENKELLEIRNIQACKINCLDTELEELNNDYEALDNELYITRNSVDSLVKENEKLKKAIEIIIREKIKPSAFLGILKDYQYHNKGDIPYEKVSIYLDCEVTQQEYDLLKEVLGND